MELLHIFGEFMSLLEGKKYILIGIIVVLLAAIPLTVLFLQQNQETRSRAQAATTLYFSSPGQTTEATTIQAKAGENVPIDIVMNPGSNQVSFVKLSISYDPTKLIASESGGIQPNALTFPSVLEGPTYTNGNISITLSIGADPTKVVQTASKIATVTFKAKESTGSTPTQIRFLDGQTQVLSIASTDQPSENVLASSKPVNITIGAGTGTTPSPSPSSSPGPTTASVAPSCTGLVIDRSPSGPAPLSLTFTANGRDTDGTISKVTFNFGDGPVQDMSQGGGIGTNTVSVPISHTYNNPGTFQASAIITDNQGNISSSTCTQTITVTARPTTAPRTGGGNPGGVGGTASATQTPPQIVAPTTVPAVSTQTPQPTMASPGPGDTLVKVGLIGTILSIVGALTFFAL